jgi:hypothetical protein
LKSTQQGRGGLEKARVGEKALDEGIERAKKARRGERHVRPCHGEPVGPGDERIDGSGRQLSAWRPRRAVKKPIVDTVDFGHAFEAVTMQIKEAMKRESDAIIESVIDGPHKRVIDKMRQVLATVLTWHFHRTCMGMK